MTTSSITSASLDQPCEVLEKCDNAPPSVSKLYRMVLLSRRHGLAHLVARQQAQKKLHIVSLWVQWIYNLHCTGEATNNSEQLSNVLRTVVGYFGQYSAEPPSSSRCISILVIASVNCCSWLQIALFSLCNASMLSARLHGICMEKQGHKQNFLSN